MKRLRKSKNFNVVTEGAGVEPPSGRSQSAGFRDQKALPSLRALRWSESRDSNPVSAVLRTAASTTSASPTWHTREELNPESQVWRLLPSPSGRVSDTPGRSRTCKLTRFELAPSTHSATGVELVGRGRLELPCSGRLVLSEVCLPDSTTGPCPGRASNPQNCGSQPQASANCATWTSWCARQDSNLRSR